MFRSSIRLSLFVLLVGALLMTVPTRAKDPQVDFGAWVQDQLQAHSEELFGFTHPLAQSAPGPYTGADNLQAIQVADGLKVSLVSSSVASATDQIAFWPNDEHPTHVFVCDEETSTPAVQRVDLSGPAGSNATTIVTGLSSWFITGSEERAMYDNVAFQPHTGNLVVLEDGPVDVVKSANHLVTELRGNDLWICLPDGKDDDALTDGCARFASTRDTSAEPTGFIFFGSGEEALVSIQHRSVNDALGEANHGALIKISGFNVKSHDDDNFEK